MVLSKCCSKCKETKVKFWVLRNVTPDCFINRWTSHRLKNEILILVDNNGNRTENLTFFEGMACVEMDTTFNSWYQRRYGRNFGELSRVAADRKQNLSNGGTFRKFGTGIPQPFDWFITKALSSLMAVLEVSLTGPGFEPWYLSLSLPLIHYSNAFYDVRPISCRNVTCKWMT